MWNPSCFIHIVLQEWNQLLCLASHKSNVVDIIQYNDDMAMPDVPPDAWWWSREPCFGLTLNSSSPGQNGRHFADDISKCVFLNENVWIPIKISLKFVPKGPINNIPSLVLIMVSCRPGAKPLSEPMMVVYRRIYASLGLNELNDRLY